MHIGTDICDPKRIDKVYKKFAGKFLKRLLTTNEIKQLDPDYDASGPIHIKLAKREFIHRLAGRYAAKEAIAKLMGTGIGEQLSFQDIEVLRQDSGAPEVKFLGKANKLAEKLEIENCKVSISHEKEMVVAFALAY